MEIQILGKLEIGNWKNWGRFSFDFVGNKPLNFWNKNYYVVGDGRFTRPTSFDQKNVGM